MTEFASILHAFTSYRREHPKGAYTAALRRRAVEELLPEERLKLAAHLGLSSKQIARWELLPGVKPRAAHFIEVKGAQLTGAVEEQAPSLARGVGGDLKVEIELPGGALVRLSGNVDTAVLRIALAAVQGAGTAS
jgi:hypothetical protein